MEYLKKSIILRQKTRKLISWNLYGELNEVEKCYNATSGPRYDGQCMNDGKSPKAQ
jgi:hypothetical protein